MIITVIAAIIAILPLTTHLQSRRKASHFHTVFTADGGPTHQIIKVIFHTDPVHPTCGSILLISPNGILFLLFFWKKKNRTPILHALSSLMVIDGVRQQSTEQRVASSPRQPASEGEGEEAGSSGGGRRGGGGGGGWDLKAKRAKKK